MTDVENAQYDPSASVRVQGKQGLFAGETARILIGQALVVGRSRMCDLSVARSGECQRMGRDALERHKSYRKISRKHLRICLVDADHLEIEDLSTNGTAVNGFRVDRVRLDLRNRGDAILVEFGEGELLEVRPAGPLDPDSDEARRIQSASRRSEDVPSGYDHSPVP